MMTACLLLCQGQAKPRVILSSPFLSPDPGTGTQLKALFTSDEWLSGKTTATLLATVKDYMSDVQVHDGRRQGRSLNCSPNCPALVQATVENSFVKRIAESALEELVRRYVNILLGGVSQVMTGGRRTRQQGPRIRTALASFWDG